MQPAQPSYNALHEQQWGCVAGRPGPIQLHALQTANGGFSFPAFLLTALQESWERCGDSRHCRTTGPRPSRKPAKARNAAHCRAKPRGTRRNHPALDSGKISAAPARTARNACAAKQQLLPARALTALPASGPPVRCSAAQPCHSLLPFESRAACPPTRTAAWRA